MDGADDLITDDPVPATPSLQLALSGRGCPYGFYETLRLAGRLTKYAENAYVVSRWEDVVSVTQRPDVFHHFLGGPEGTDHTAQYVPDYDPDIPTASIYTPHPAPFSDGEDHKIKRSWVLRLTERDRLRSYEPVANEICDMLIDRFAGRGECEFRSEFAELLPSYMMCEILGTPKDDAVRFQQWADEIQHGIMTSSSEQFEQTRNAWRELSDYMLEAVLRRYKKPTTDFLSELLHAQIARDGTLDINFQVAQGVNLVLAGSETTAHVLVNTLSLLCRQPGLERRVREDRTLLRPLIEESMRLETPIQWNMRRCMVDTKLSGVTIPAGALVSVVWAAANRDPAKFEHPDTLDIERPNLAKTQLGFGRGIHLCAGAPLARLEIAIAFDRLLSRLTNITINDAEDQLTNITPTSKDAVLPARMRGPASLAIAFDRQIKCLSPARPLLQDNDVVPR